MKERPILFSGPMVRAILEGRKTQTRRIVKGVQRNNCMLLRKPTATRAGLEVHVLDAARHGLCPYGVSGDRFWVRENFSAHGAFGASGRISYMADAHDGIEPHGLHWKPSIFMRRWASRILLEVTSVRVERLQSISADDAAAEGFKKLTKDDGRTWKYGLPDRDGLPGNDDDGWHWREWRQSPVDAYKKLWESINGAGSWGKNPWVWAIEFERITP